jgi:hypothetical protein
MDLATLKKAVDALLEQGVEGDEPICLKTASYAENKGDGLYTVSGITIVVESDDWVPGTVILTVEEIEDS